MIVIIPNIRERKARAFIEKLKEICVKCTMFVCLKQSNLVYHLKRCGGITLCYKNDFLQLRRLLASKRRLEYTVLSKECTCLNVIRKNSIESMHLANWTCRYVKHFKDGRARINVTQPSTKASIIQPQCTAGHDFFKLQKNICFVPW